MSRVLAVLVLACAIAGCSGVSATVVPTAASRATAAPTQAATGGSGPSLAAPTPEPTPEVTPAPEGPTQYAVGQVITLTNNSDPWATVTVTKVSVHNSYSGSYGYVEKPQVKGNVYIQAYVTYKALTDGVDYNQFDWSVFVGGQAVDNFAFAVYGPKPTLSSGSLPKGRTAAGWLIYEVAPKGQVLVDYGNNSFTNQGPVFEVVLRAK